MDEIRFRINYLNSKLSQTQEYFYQNFPSNISDREKLCLTKEDIKDEMNELSRFINKSKITDTLNNKYNCLIERFQKSKYYTE